MTIAKNLTLLDGGMGRQLERMGAPFRLPEWSAQALIEAPEYVLRAHLAFVESGADVITTNSYGLVPHMIGDDRFNSVGPLLADRAGQVARQAAGARSRLPAVVAGSLPPTIPSYRPSLFDAGSATRTLEVLVGGLAPYVDFWLIETQSSVAEALAAIEVTRATPLPAWVSFTLRDEAGRTGPALLRSGETVEEAVRAVSAAGAQAILFNCSQPEAMGAAVQATRRLVPGSQVGVYANAFVPEPPSDEPYAGISQLRADLTPQRYLEWAREWINLGATIIGGCCGIGPEHIAALRDGLR
jgi:S-methylmethionine-dependent homocysteine/selenocysteine methylase